MITTERMAAIKEEHVAMWLGSKEEGQHIEICAACAEDWPCDAAWLLERLEAAQTVLAWYANTENWQQGPFAEIEGEWEPNSYSVGLGQPEPDASTMVGRRYGRRPSPAVYDHGKRAQEALANG